MSDVLSVLETVAVTALDDLVHLFTVFLFHLKSCHFLQHICCDILLWLHSACHLDAETLVRHLEIWSVFVYKVSILRTETGLQCDLSISFKETGVEFSITHCSPSLFF